MKLSSSISTLVFVALGATSFAGDTVNYQSYYSEAGAGVYSTAPNSPDQSSASGNGSFGPWTANHTVSLSYEYGGYHLNAFATVRHSSEFSKWVMRGRGYIDVNSGGSNEDEYIAGAGAYTMNHANFSTRGITPYIYEHEGSLADRGFLLTEGLFTNDGDTLVDEFVDRYGMGVLEGGLDYSFKFDLSAGAGAGRSRFGDYGVKFWPNAVPASLITYQYYSNDPGDFANTIFEDGATTPIRQRSDWPHFGAATYFQLPHYNADTLRLTMVSRTQMTGIKQLVYLRQPNWNTYAVSIINMVPGENRITVDIPNAQRWIVPGQNVVRASIMFTRPNGLVQAEAEIEMLRMQFTTP